MPPARARCSVEEPNSALVPPGGISHLRTARWHLALAHSVCRVVTFPYFLWVGYAACEEFLWHNMARGASLNFSSRQHSSTARKATRHKHGGFFSSVHSAVSRTREQLSYN